tara:strand:+ start:10 stop:747 length:738 start_codon:yes stop_codon:yes gene_type:complete
MSVKIDTVYQAVLALANKEQRGYITPQEFNLFAHQAQMDIYENYFYDLNQAKRLPGHKENESDLSSIIYDKLSNFSKVVSLSAGNPTNSGQKRYTLPLDFYRFIACNSPGKSPNNVDVEKKTKKDYFACNRTPLLKGTEKRPILYFEEEDSHIWISGLPAYANSAQSIIELFYYKMPETPKWGYVVVQEKPFYNANTSKDFELHPSELENLVFKILALAGVSIKDYNLATVAQSAELLNVQNQKS